MGYYTEMSCSNCDGVGRLEKGRVCLVCKGSGIERVWREPPPPLTEEQNAKRWEEGEKYRKWTEMFDILIAIGILFTIASLILGLPFVLILCYFGFVFLFWLIGGIWRE